MATPEETIENVEKDRNVNARQLAVVAGGLVILLAALWFFFLRGSSEPETTTQPSAPSTESSENGDKSKGRADNKRANKNRKGDKKAPKSTAGPVESFELFAPRDPFLALVDGSSGGTDDTGQTVGGTEGSEENVSGHTVRLVDIFTGDDGEEQAQVEVDGTVYRVSEGEVFAESFELVSIQGNCATMLFGDDQFTLCQGEEILK